VNKIIDSEKYLDLSTKFALHEEWVQKGCPTDKRPETTIPGYFALASQNGDAYGFYRRSLLPYLSEARGKQHFFQEFSQIITECEVNYPEAMALFWQAHNLPTEKFIGQWDNLFERFESTKLAHENCFKYQQKYEIEHPLIFLAQLRQICSKKGFDKTLNRFRDNQKKLKKGVVANYIVDGFENYSKVKELILTAYNPKLRNLIGHNNYKISGNQINSLEEPYTVTGTEFWNSYISLQEVQNVILWLLSGPKTVDLELAKYGVAAVGFELEDAIANPSSMYIFQIHPFRTIDPKANWLNRIRFSVKGGVLNTNLSPVDNHSGEISESLTQFLKSVKQENQVIVKIIPIMPCIHKKCEPIETGWGTYCQYGNTFKKVVPAIVV
jgi:hypothetical protein